MRCIGIIPARYDSSRFKGKVLETISEYPLVVQVYRQAINSNLDEVIIATDIKKVQDTCESYDVKVSLTSADHKSGTDRCAEVAQYFEDDDIIVNIQGDEPFIQPEHINLLLDKMTQGETNIATLIKVLTDQQELLSPNTVKVVKNLRGEALYFSRAGIPFLRDTALREWIKNHTFYKHIGVYAYKNQVLQSLTNLSNSSLENAESLEQLRWLENGYNIATIESNYGGIGIDTYSDLLKARELAQANPDLLK